MEINSTRTVQPETVRLSVNLNTEDVSAAFIVADPDEELFFQLFSPKWLTLGAAEQLRTVARVIELAEQARSLGLTAAAPEPK